MAAHPSHQHVGCFVCLFIYLIFFLVPASLVSGLVDWLMMMIRVCFVSDLAIEFQCDIKPHLHSTSLHNVSQFHECEESFVSDLVRGITGWD